MGRHDAQRHEQRTYANCSSEEAHDSTPSPVAAPFSGDLAVWPILGTIIQSVFTRRLVNKPFLRLTFTSPKIKDPWRSLSRGPSLLYLAFDYSISARIFTTATFVVVPTVAFKVALETVTTQSSDATPVQEPEPFDVVTVGAVPSNPSRMVST